MITSESWCYYVLYMGVEESMITSESWCYYVLYIGVE